MPRPYFVQHLATSRRRMFAIIATLVLVCAGTRLAHAQTPPPWRISVGGRLLTMTDIGRGMMLEFGASARTAPVTKKPKQMPSFAPYAWYAGRDAHGKPIVWMVDALEGKKKPSDAVAAEARREIVAAGVLYALDAGAGGPTWQRLYHALPNDPAVRTKFAGEIIAAVQAASEWSVARSAADRQWIFANVRAGLSRQHVYELLDARDLTATDESQREKHPPNGPAYVLLPGEFQPGCSFSNTVTIAFDSADRVFKVDLSPPKPNCL